MYVYTWLTFLAVLPFLHVCPLIPSPPLSVSLLSSLETTFKLDLFPELELEDEDGDDGNQIMFVLHVYTDLVPMAVCYEYCF